MVNESGELGMVQKQDQQEELLQDELGQSQMVACGGGSCGREAILCVSRLGSLPAPPLGLGM